MKRSGVYLLICVLIACSRDKGAVNPQRKTLVEAIYASGYVTPMDEYRLYSLADGYLVDKLADEGDTVAAGQPLFRLDALQQEARSRLNEQLLRQAEENSGSRSPVLLELKAQISTARLKYENDSVNYVRYKVLQQQDATSRAEFERRQLAWRASLNEYRALAERYERTAKQLQTELVNARSQSTISNVDMDRYLIRSSMPGRVYEVYKEKGELVKRGEPVALLGDAHRMYISLLIDEKDIAKVQEGLEVQVKIDALDNKVLRGHVSKVHPMMRKMEQSFRVDALLDVPAPGLRAGLSAEANIIVRQKEGALVIPRSYITGSDSVRVKTPDGRKYVRIVKGIENFDEVEVVSGLTEADIILPRK